MRTSIGRYSVTGTLGEGGMGVVYSAYDDRLGRPIAIKMLRAASSDPAARDRLFREARAAASLNHPAICQLYEVGEDAGDLFLAMELLLGESLATRLDRGPLPLQEAGAAILGILTGVEALHRQGLVHRDLKPTNIFLTPHGVKLLDFGLAFSFEAAAEGETLARLTAAGMVVGTPQYAAPEQLRGEVIDGRADIFAAGVILYEMLSGKPPFAGRSPVEVFHAIIYEQPPVLSGGAVVMALDRVVHRALGKKPADRYADVEAMARDIRAALALADTNSTVTPRAVTRLMVLPLRSLRPDEETDFLAFGLADAISSALSGLQSLVVRSSLAASRFASDAPDLKAIASDAEVDAIVVGTLLRSGGQLRVSTQLLEVPSGTVVWSQTTQAPVGDLFAVQDDLTGKIVESLSLPLTARERRMLKQDVPATPQVYERYLRANEMSRETGQWRAALELYQQCVADDPHYAPAWAGVGRMFRLIGKYMKEEGGQEQERAEAALKRALELNPDHSVAENIYAHLEVDLGRAEQSMVRLITRARERPADPELYAGLVHSCRYCGLLRASIAAVEQARRLDSRVRTSGAHTFFMLGDYEAVLDFQFEAIPYMRNLALVMLGRTDEALVSLKAIDSGTENRLLHVTRALELLIEGRPDESFAALQPLFTLPDPEGRYYFARHAAHLGFREPALELLGGVVDEGFFCLPALARDPWLDSVRAMPEFGAILRRAEHRHRQALISFLNAEGDRVLGVSHPV
ncbi:MAG: protein kinase [Acidobacteria bacterium]|nr:protein kinase [Acidobacteriota bacterium]MBA3887351.1 protein kinase [Acidobacteriota bacterium]